MARSQSLGRAVAVSGSYTTLLTVAAGFVAILKSAIVWNGSGVAANVQVVVQDSGGTVTGFVVKQQLANDATKDWEGWVALNAGDKLRITSDQGTCHFWLSGALLRTS